MEEKKVQPQRPTNPNFNSNARKDIPRPPVRPIPKPPQRPEVKHEISQQKFEEKGGVEKMVEAVKSQPVEPKVKKQREKLSDQSKGILYGLLGGMFVALAIVFFVFMLIYV